MMKKQLCIIMAALMVLFAGNAFAAKSYATSSSGSYAQQGQGQGQAQQQSQNQILKNSGNSAVAFNNSFNGSKPIRYLPVASDVQYMGPAPQMFSRPQQDKGDEFIAAKNRQREIDLKYPEGEGYEWEWDSSANRTKFEDLRIRSAQSDKFASFAVAGLVLHRVVSLIDVDRDGLLFEYSNAASLAEAVSTLLANGALRRKMGIAGQRKTLNNYTWESVSEQFRRLYQEVWERYQNQ